MPTVSSSQFLVPKPSVERNGETVLLTSFQKPPRNSQSYSLDSLGHGSGIRPGFDPRIQCRISISLPFQLNRFFTPSSRRIDYRPPPFPTSNQFINETSEKLTRCPSITSKKRLFQCKQNMVALKMPGCNPRIHGAQYQVLCWSKPPDVPK